MKRNSIIALSSMLLLIFFFYQDVTFAKSLYVVAEHHQANFDSYNINPDGTVTYQQRYGLQYATDPAGVAIWEDPLTSDAFLFITSEFNLAGFEIVDATTMQYVGIAPANSSNLAGIDVDDINLVVYTVRRWSNDLYVYDWNPATRTITPRPGFSPYDLPGCVGAFGIALDETRGILWVADTAAGRVRAYSTTDFTENSSLSFTPIHYPVDVKVDRKRNAVYTVSIIGGASVPYGTGSYNLSKYDVATSTETYQNMGWPGVGLAVDEVTGYVYVTGGALVADNLSVWDTSQFPFRLVDNTGDIGNPAGLAIANASYNPLRLAKNDIIQGEGISIGGQFTYHISCDNSFNPALDVTNVTLLDTLPQEVDYISNNYNGVYDPVNHTIFWDVGTIPAGHTGPEIDLEVQVNQNAVEGMTIHNYVTIDGDQVPPTTVIDQDPDDPSDEPGTNIISLCGDLDDDGDVDGDDRNILRAAFSTIPGDSGYIEEADYDEDGDIDYNDYREWYKCYLAFINS